VNAFTVEADLPGGPDAAARARQLVEVELAGRLPGELIADVALLVTELVANGVRHGGGTTATSLHVVLEGKRPGLRVEVVNAEHVGGKVVPRRPDYAGGGGLGLHLVDALSSRWGVRGPPPTAVWFELGC
jgi:anti-sigma regulatory factor (Ser/Thr protein kinase)